LNAPPGADAALPGVVGAVVLPHDWLGCPVAGPVGLLGLCGSAAIATDGMIKQVLIVIMAKTPLILCSFQ
jgi:hypothetical protein